MSKYKRTTTLYIQDILESLDKIERYVNNMNYEEFCENELVIDAVVRNFSIIGEAANRIPKEIQNIYDYVEWREIIGFRNVIIHDYFHLYIETVWDTIKNNLPSLHKNVLRMKMEIEKSN